MANGSFFGYNPSFGGYNPLFSRADLGVMPELGIGSTPTPTPTEGGGMNMGAMMGLTQALTGLAGSFQDVANQRSALKIKQIQNRINKRFAKAQFERQMTGLFQAHRDLEEQAVQAHALRDAAYQQKMGRLKVMQAERNMAGTSAQEQAKQVFRSNLVAEQIMIKNMIYKSCDKV